MTPGRDDCARAGTVARQLRQSGRRRAMARCSTTRGDVIRHDEVFSSHIGEPFFSDWVGVLVASGIQSGIRVSKFEARCRFALCGCRISHLSSPARMRLILSSSWAACTLKTWDTPSCWAPPFRLRQTLPSLTGPSLDLLAPTRWNGTVRSRSKDT